MRKTYAAAVLAVTLLAALAPPADGAQTIWAAGDQHSCRGVDTSGIIGDYGTVVAVGDMAAEDGWPEEYECYEPTWGRFKDRTLAVAGNHDFYSGGQGFLDYFADQLGPSSHPTYYRRKIGAWQVFVLDTNCEQENPALSCGRQAQWLRRALDRSPTRCVAAFYHKPSHSSIKTSSQAVELFGILQRHDADLVISAHRHGYERFKKFGSLREIVVGTGGANNWHLDETDGPAYGSQARVYRTHGVLRLTLRWDRYVWRFIGLDGQILDRGWSRCR